MLIGIEHKNFTLFLKFAYTSKPQLLGKLFYHMPGRPVGTLIENHCMKKKKNKTWMRAVAVTQELPLCSCVQPRQMRVERGKEERNRRSGMSSSRMIKCVLIKRGTNGQTDLQTQPCSVRDLGPNGTCGPFKVNKYIFHLMYM